MLCFWEACNKVDLLGQKLLGLFTFYNHLLFMVLCLMSTVLVIGAIVNGEIFNLKLLYETDERIQFLIMLKLLWFFFFLFGRILLCYNRYTVFYLIFITICILRIYGHCTWEILNVMFWLIW